MSLADPLSRFRLDGRVAIVTGASSGLGVGVAEALAGAGARVALVARRRDRLEDLASRIGGLAIACDLLDEQQTDAVVDTVVAGLGAPEILVNAAGTMFTEARAEDEPADAITSTFRLNVIAPFRLSQLVFPHLRQRQRGAIVNISSISGHVGIPGIPQASYAATKAALSGLTVELAVQWARHQIRVNAVAPGFFRSEITDVLYDTDKSAEWVRRNTPLPVQGTVDDITGAVLWLVSDAGSYVTGQTIRVDGGWTAR